MKRYPSIPRRLKGRRHLDTSGTRVHVFDKLDGSNLRFEWSRSEGWFRFGSRHLVLDEAHKTFGVAMQLFREQLATPIERVARNEGWESLIAFAEFWNEGALGGQLHPDNPLRLTLFDVAPFKQGFLGPERFLERFGECETPRYLGVHTWDEALVKRVREGNFEGVTFEGIVGKAGDRHRVIRVKAKTQAWIDAIVRRYGDKSHELINS
ncbi:MAG: hypothetical protein ACPG77_12705 [Nannocystaceae bacterium]